MVWRIRSDVAFQYYVISPKKTRCYFIINTNRPWLITLAATMHLSGLSLRAFIWVSLANTLHLSAQQNQSANVYFPTPHRLPQELIYHRSFSLGSTSALSLSKSALRRRHTYRPHSHTRKQFSTTTTGSKVNLPENHALITRKDLRQSIACFEEVGRSFMTAYHAMLMLF